MKTKAFFIATVLLTVIIFFSASSCANTPMKGYKGPELTADKTATIGNGVYLYMEKCDGVRLGPFQDKVVVLPGEHMIEMAFQTQIIADIVLYSRKTASVTFKAKAGHSYVAYAKVISKREWIANIIDKKTDELVAQSEALPIIEEWFPQM